ncbi:MAG: sialate O-acetylesterase [Candidatus Limivivens sp.]|nr:sialate O-acetylesterase [Candidatus Limivivens sp.]
MHGITLTKAPADWEILQHRDGFAPVFLAGTYQVHPAAIDVGVESAKPMARVMREDDNTAVVPWTYLDDCPGEHFSGTFSGTLMVPAGGLYRIETCLETKSTLPDLTWLYRGDCVLHLGIGNIFILAGQSNSAGYGKDSACDAPDLMVHLFRNRSRWDLATHPMNESTAAGSLPNEEMGIPGVSPYLSFGKNFSRISGLPVGLIQTTLGGSPISRWLPETGDLYQNLLDKIALTGGSYAGVLWYQGCSDADADNAPLYLERFCSMVKDLRSRLGYEIPFFTFQLNRFLDVPGDEYWGMIREAQRKATKLLPKVWILPTTNCALSDAIHNCAHANMQLGEKLAKLCGHILCGQEPFFAPELESVSHAEEKVLCLTYRNVRLGFSLYSGMGSKSGFTLTDAEGEIEITRIRANREDRNHIYLYLSRAPKNQAELSFAWQADPVEHPPVDEVTFLPPLSFYHLPLSLC